MTIRTLPAGRRVLVVDDEKAIRDLVIMRLEIAGFATSAASDGLSALARIRDFKPHAMILDINMPLLDGFGLMARMGKDQLSTIPTLVLTARGQVDDVKRAITLGARDYLSKPFRDDHLLARMARLCRLDH
jgi:DNA-binding response OmpR family regulator